MKSSSYYKLGFNNNWMNKKRCRHTAFFVSLIYLGGVLETKCIRMSEKGLLHHGLRE